MLCGSGAEQHQAVTDGYTPHYVVSQQGHGEVSLEYIGGGTPYISGRILCGAGAEQHQAAIDGALYSMSLFSRAIMKVF